MRARIRLPWCIQAALVGATLVGWHVGAWAQPAEDRGDAPAIRPEGAHALGRVLTAGPAPTGPTLTFSGGYGHTESVLGMGDAHHRLAGALTLDERLLPWLAFALRLDGRYDAHVTPGQPTDAGFVGDPRVYVRVDREWQHGLRFGARAGLWMPGGNAPSLTVGALSPELVALASLAPPGSALAVTANLGYRVDRSDRTAPDAARLSAADRLALGVSAFDQVLVGAAVSVGRGRAQGFAEVSADVLVGSGAPALAESPIFLGVGGRLALGQRVVLEGEVEASPSRRPSLGPTAPPIPVPPRVSLWLGIAVRLDTAEPSQPRAVAPSQRPAPAETRPPATVAPPPGAAEAVTPETVTGPDGSAERGGETTAPARPAQGQLRGLVRSLRGSVIAAEIQIEPENGASADTTGAAMESLRRRAEGGRFQVDVPPGRYRVMISAPGYQTQQRKVDVEDNGVTVLNVDLRPDR